MSDSAPPSYPPETIQLLQRIFRLRSSFKLILPENIATLKQQLRESLPSGKGLGADDADLFYNAGSIFDRHEEPITMGELSRELEVPLSTATRTMDWLVETGYARRLSDPKDRRIVRVGFTRRGKETYRTLNAFLVERVEQILGSLSPAERESFLGLLNKVLNAFEETTGQAKQDLPS